MAISQPPEKPDPTAMSEEQLAELLTKAGGRTITSAMIEKDVRDGAPTNGDGSFMELSLRIRAQSLLLLRIVIFRRWI